ncbi:hypothetical protein ACIQVT_01990 [Streptomyces sp. NPDC100445]|uniref:hypothetical protein n=1 Tax=Streptomyces sp. NPDC100445 TaxID=3366102 RepID=UPI00380CEBF5
MPDAGVRSCAGHVPSPPASPLPTILHRHALSLPGAVLLALLTPAPLLSAWNARAPYIQPRRILFQRLRSGLGRHRIASGTTLGDVLTLPLTPLFGPGFALADGSGFAAVFGLGLALSVRLSMRLSGARSAARCCPRRRLLGEPPPSPARRAPQKGSGSVTPAR